MPLPAGSPQDWTLAQRARASFDAERSGDVVVLLRARGDADPGGDHRTMSPPTAVRGTMTGACRCCSGARGCTGSSSPPRSRRSTSRRRWPRLIGLPYAAGEFDGRCLDLDGGAGDSCGGAPMSENRDLVILGGGLVGMTLALAAAKAGLTSHVVDNADPAGAHRRGCRRPRFGDLDRELEPVHQHRPRRPARTARLPDRVDRGDRRDEARPDRFPARTRGRLARPDVRQPRPRLALFDAARAEPAIAWHTRAEVAARERGAFGVSVTLGDGRMLSGSLLVAAEGRRSPTRDEAGFTMARWDYRHRAMVTALTHELAARGRRLGDFLSRRAVRAAAAAG